MINKSKLNLPACLIIMDGFGIDVAGEANAISLSNTPNLDRLFTHSNTILDASGEAVGLPEGQMGNSEVGHLNIGAGRVVHQELSRINLACRNDEIVSNEVLVSAFENCTSNDGVLHLMGLLSDGGVHSSNEHLYALIKAAIKHGVKNVFVHCFLDGRDVPPQSAIIYVNELNDFISDLPESSDVQIATISGRYYAMDRDNRWDRVEQAYNTIVCAENEVYITPAEAIQKSYDEGVTDEFFVPTSFQDRGMQNEDSVIFFNFRPDRARELTRAIAFKDFDCFDRCKVVDTFYVCLTEYDATFGLPIAFPKEFPQNVLADVIANEGLTQYHIAETEKYAHVTFFLNGGIEAEKEGEKRVLIPSPKVATYDLKPDMSEGEVADTLVEAIDDDEADIYIVNFANCDMVGHTGDIDATIAAVQAVDEGVGKVVDAIVRKGGICFVTADHGNADKMLSDDGAPHTAHTTAPVPFILVDASGNDFELCNQKGALCDIAPTMLTAVGIALPTEMTGQSLLASD